jgi:hypothetical protein
MAAAISASGLILVGLFRVLVIPVLYFERTQVAISGLSNRVDEISYKLDILLDRPIRVRSVAGAGQKNNEGAQ